MTIPLNKFGIFMALSMVTHAAVLIFAWPNQTTHAIEQDANYLDIELLTKTDTIAQPEHRPARSEIYQNRHASLSTETQQSLTEKPGSKDHSENISETADQTNDSSQQTARTGIISEKISIEFSRYFYYPDAARRRNRQGDVVLQFTLLPDGQLDQIHIQQSSGFKSLDAAALHALQQVKPQQELALLTDAARTHILPVSFRLTNPL